MSDYPGVNVSAIPLVCHPSVEDEVLSRWEKILSLAVQVLMSVLLASLSPISGRRTPKPLGKRYMSNCSGVNVGVAVLVVAHQLKTNSEAVGRCMSECPGVNVGVFG